MIKSESQNSNKRASDFKPNMKNFLTSLAYEGLAVKKDNAGKSIKELKLKYAR